MRLIVAHEQPDFDALASIALAKLLFPGSAATVQGAITPPLTAFLRLYRDLLDLQEAERIDLNAVTQLIVVDTADPARIRPFDSLIGKVPVTLYDHHPLPESPIAASHGLSQRVGATATLLTRELKATGITIPPAIASLALLGIHEDTGNLSYDLTMPEDHEAAAHLLHSGASLRLVRRFASGPLDDEQLAFRSVLHGRARPLQIAGRPAVVAAFDYPGYVAGVSDLISDLAELHHADAVVVAVRMEGRTLVFTRASERFDSATALAEAIGGAGHPGAAFGKTDMAPEEALTLVLLALEHHAAPVVTAAQIMTFPVRTVTAQATVAEASAELLRYGHNGLPVLGESGSVAGVLSRRDLDRALRHGLGASRVSGFMTRPAVTASPGASLRELEELVIQRNIGRIPIVEGGRLVGIVTRADLIQARHASLQADDAAGDLLDRLPPVAADAVWAAAELAAAEASSLYLVGGSVRDLLLGAGSKDLDLMVEGGTAERLGSLLRQRLGGTLSCHIGFGTCTLVLDDGLTIDVATAREEVYQHPGALPEVVESSLRKDLQRRDFSVNAMALRIQPAPVTLLDPFGARDDLSARRLRVLHPLSFVEDPTRILRGARLAGRLGFGFEPETGRLLLDALASGAARSVSRSRLRAELELTLAEPRVGPAITLLSGLGVLEAVFGLSGGGPRSRDLLVTALDTLRHEVAVPPETAAEAYLLALLLAATSQEAELHVEEFSWPRRHLQTRDRLERLLDPALLEPLLDEELEDLDLPERLLVRAADADLAARLQRLESSPRRRRLRGSDVVALGLPPSPAVGRVLAEVARARADQRANTFEEELELARRLVEASRAT